MHPDDELQTTLSKWPFILGDVLLVGSALAIAILGGWQLTDWQVAACVAAVALGAALFVLPYVVEFQVRVREEREDRRADLRVMEKHLMGLGERLSSVELRLRPLESELAEAIQQQSALAEITEQQLAQLEAARSSQAEVLEALRQDFEQLPQEAAAALEPELLQALEARLAALEARPDQIAGTSVQQAEPERSEAVAEPELPEEPNEPHAEQEPTEAEAVPEPEEAEQEPEESNCREDSGRQGKQVAPLERPRRSPRGRHSPQESRLLQRAITEGDHSSAAVSRIIAFKAQAQQPEQSAAPLPESDVSADAADTEPAADAEPAEDPDLKVRGTATEPSGASVPAAPEPPLEATADDASAADAAAVDAEPDTPAALGQLLEDAAASAPAPRSKAKKKDAVLTASVFIGIGNKPYLRGSGGGLSWEQGVAMEFQEIGKWQWIAPDDLDAAIELQIFRNDEDADRSGRYTLEPGQKLAVNPVF